MSGRVDAAPHDEPAGPHAAERVQPTLEKLEAWRRLLSRSEPRAKDFRQCLREVARLDPVDVARLDARYQTVRAILLVFFASDAIDPQRVTAITAAVLCGRFGISEYTDPDPRLLGQIVDDELLLRLLSQTLNTDLQLEAFLRKLRTGLLDEHARTGTIEPARRPLLFGLARQCFNNEYVYRSSAGEESHLEMLDAILKERGAPTSAALAALPLFVAGMYSPVHSSVLAESLVPSLSQSPGGDPELRRTFDCLVTQPRRERKLAESLPSLGPIRRHAVRAVRDQYERHCYPRSLGVYGTYPSLRDSRKRFSDGLSEPEGERAVCSILVPGCGSGKHPLSVALANPNDRVLAVDVSRRSVSQAMRLAEERRIQNIDFLHGDLLDLPGTSRTFHHADCVGVLHHLECPIEGWRALYNVLKPGGTLRLGLYSRVARLHLGRLRELAGASVTDPDHEGLTLARDRLLARRESRELIEFAQTRDLFHTSGIRDLLFHTREREYTVAEIAELIEAVGFRFVGVDFGRLRRRYRELYSSDPFRATLSDWRRFERHMAGSASLFDFWLQRPHPEPSCPGPSPR